MTSEPDRGRFITLEGGEGTGKSTLQAALASRLEALGIPVVVTREPGGTPLAEAIRDLLLHPPRGEKWTPLAEALLVNAARTDHLGNVIRPALAAGTWVICDRFIDSTRVYQGVGDRVAGSVLRMMETAVVGETMPDLTLILDAPVDLAAGRRAVRAQAADAFERRPPEFHHDVREAFAVIAKSEPRRCRLIDASIGAEDVADDAWQEITRRLLTGAPQ